MARPRYPSDDKRKRQRPHVKVHLSITNHPTYGHVFADPLLRGVVLGIWVIAARAHVSATNDELTLTAADVLWITGKDRMVDGAKLLRRACEATAYTLRISCDRHATCQRNTCERPAKWVIQVRYFSRKQGFTPQTPTETPHNSAPSEEPKNQRTDIPHSATPPAITGDSQNSSVLPPAKDSYQLEFEAQVKPAYPRRDGDQRWQQALQNYRVARKKDGESLEAILAGIERYTLWLEDKGLVGTDKVKQAASFLGKEKCWRQSWEIPTERARHVNGGFVG